MIYYGGGLFDFLYVVIRGSASIWISQKRIAGYYHTLLSELGVYKEVSSANGWTALQIKPSTGFPAALINQLLK